MHMVKAWTGARQQDRLEYHEWGHAKSGAEVLAWPQEKVQTRDSASPLGPGAGYYAAGLRQ